jgi:hypothetical protein
MSLPPLLQSVVAFVRKGYPQGVPRQDYLPLFALLRRRLSEDEISEIAAELAATAADAPDSRAISAAIERLTLEAPSDSDVERVRRRLEAAGWEPDAAPPIA